MKPYTASTQITDEGIKKHFKSFDPERAIFEMVWNGLDANAKTVRVETHYNNLKRLETVLIIDEGDGIDVENLENSFGKFNESLKKKDDDKHGSHGKGRLSFHRLSGKAVWHTKRKNINTRITIDSTPIKDFSYEPLPSEDSQHPSLRKLESGTCVELFNCEGNVLPEETQLIEKLSVEFGWYLALNPKKTIKLNGNNIPVPKHELYEEEFCVDNHDFTAKIFRWEERPGKEKSYHYLVNKNHKIVRKELSSHNNKVSFFSSTYVFSDWIDSYNPDMIELDPDYELSSKVMKSVLAKITILQRNIYKNYLRCYADSEIEKYDEKGYFPSYKYTEQNYSDWRKNNTKLVLKDIYYADPTLFNNLKAKQAKILIRLLDKVLVSNENDTLFDVLNGVLDLSDDSMSRLASQLKKTTMENIISTIETLQKRQVAIHHLRAIMEDRFDEILETPDLQKIIENNTWLFGPQYATLGAEEDSFTKIAKNLRDIVRDIDVVSDQDIEDGADIEGVSRQVDLFLARKIPYFDSTGTQTYKCVIVEIKRPGISLSKKHLRQLEDYAEIISKHPSFNSDKLQFDLILIGRKLSKDDTQIKDKMNALKNNFEPGLVGIGENYKCYMKNWFTIFDDFELSNNYLLGTLNTKLEDLSGEDTKSIVSSLQTADVG